MGKTLGAVLDRIHNTLDILSPKQCQLAEYILNNYKKAAFMTSTALGSAAKVSESTVVRLAVAVGYSGFPEFQSALQELIQHELTSLERFSSPHKTDDNAFYTKVFTAEAENMIKVLTSLSPEVFKKAVDLFFAKRRVLVIGHQASACLASYAGYSLSKVRAGVYTMNKWDENAFGTIQDMGPEDVAWVHVFPRYPTDTVHITKLLHAQNVPIVLITNSILSPLAKLAEVLLPVYIRYDAFVDGLAPVMCLINSLVLETALRDRNRTAQHLEEFETFVSETQVFYPGQTPSS